MNKGLATSDGLTGDVGTRPLINVNNLIVGLLGTYVQGVNCVIAKQCASRYPNANKMEGALMGGIQAIMGVNATMSGQQGQDNNLLTVLTKLAEQQQPQQQAALPDYGKQIHYLKKDNRALHDKLDLVIKKLG